ncbi:membrane hypothetical protein [Rhizobium mesoamericanum STM3625]|uniref:Uncharacterized protein n=1 Tax=Rhizobium mesoamericanum STM3625 TaxID=1211777 RepID=K0PMP1_9HYPH|nr:membrane hypothetical protein [Rhizobium mesoamericanum STM3625]
MAIVNNAAAPIILVIALHSKFPHDALVIQPDVDIGADLRNYLVVFSPIGWRLALALTGTFCIARFSPRRAAAVVVTKAVAIRMAMTEFKMIWVIGPFLSKPAGAGLAAFLTGICA